MIVRRALIALTILTSAALGLLGPGAAVGAVTKPREVTVFPIRNCFGAQLAPAPSGVFLRTCAKGRLESSGTLTNLLPDGGSTAIAVPASQAGPIVAGPAGEVWIGANDPHEVTGEAERIERIAADGSVQAFPLAPAKRVVRRFRGFAMDDRGDLWAAIGEPWIPFIYGHGDLSAGGELLRIAPDGTESYFRLPREVEPQGLAIAPDGSVWFTAIGGRVIAEHEGSAGVGYVGRLDPEGSMTLFRTPIRYGEPSAIALGPEGRMWFTEPRLWRVGTISADGRFGHEYRLRFGAPLFANITFGPEGDLWAPVQRGLLRMTPAGRQSLYAAASPIRVVATADGAIWVLEEGRVRRIVP